ncbi:ABC-three component system protein [Rhizobium ruizarguesonis]|uniref:ABC-three component system protein n=1 Tax=Rhizobium ruizarguesonis TaxID=2081791 RepID=UPI001030D9A1|nr:ABC-three component system protein [Rhizobium ruizarguesonis]TAT84806.1 hypothetical protein ELI52_15535 [Rhizobium ruizarguesonis]
MTVAELEKPLKTSAAGQYLGFSLQQLRLAYHLFRIPDDDLASLEYLDDVAVHRADGSIVLEQCKSALSGNPAADRSADLWKTFANWGKLCHDGIVDKARTDFRYYVTPVKSGKIVAQMSAASTGVEVSELLVQLRKLTQGLPDEAACKSFLTRFLSFGDSICETIVARFEFSTENDPVEAVRQFVRPGASPNVLQEMTAAAIGLARERADTFIRMRQPAIVDATKFRRSFQSFSRRSDLGNFLISRTPPPSDADIALTVGNEPTFVRQLRAIDAKDDMLLTAVSDYLRTQIDKVQWADEGRILADSFQDFDDQLVRLHKVSRDEVEDIESSSAVGLRGRKQYRMCTSAIVALDGQTLPGHFVAGAYNHLADGRRVGWHPDYSTLFPPD